MRRRSTACTSCEPPGARSSKLAPRTREAVTWGRHPPGRPQPGRPALAAEAALLVAAERRGRVEVVVGVLPDDARLQRGRNLERLGALVGPDARRQPVLRVVG